MNYVSKTRKFVSKTRKFAFKMMNFAGAAYENYKMSYLVNDYSISCMDTQYEEMYILGLVPTPGETFT